ncbi:MAG: hypothetical protein IJU61_06410 [Victivallales bacterium]|nr:hypothetical protein [Victivallales bacterium]
MESGNAVGSSCRLLGGVRRLFFMPVQFAAAARRLVFRGIVSYQYIKQHRKTGASHPAPQWRRGTSAKFVCIPPCKTGFIFGMPRRRAAQNTGGARRKGR